MKLSDKGAALIEEFEGFRSHPYRDMVGVWTIGYGSTRGVTSTTPPVTRGAARARMKREVDATYGAAVNNIGVPLAQEQFDALTSFVYNVGPGGVAPSTKVGGLLRAQSYTEAADALLAWDYAGGRRVPGLSRRRQRERKMFLSGVYPPPKPDWSIRTRWRVRLRWRIMLETAAKRRHTKATRRLVRARRQDLHPRQHLVDDRDRQSRTLKLRREQVAVAQRVIARHS